MRVGVEIREQLPQFGGAFTFQVEVLDALLALRTETRHEFCLLPCSPAVEASLCDSATARGFEVTAFPYAALAAAPSCMQATPPTLVQRILGRLAGATPPAKAEDARQRQILITQAAAQTARVELIWCMSHGTAYFDIPYVATVWDLEHRHQPWFPEVSNDGVWEMREMGFSRDLPRATFVITGTEVGKREIERFYGVPGERVRILPHPTPRFALEAPAGLGAGAAARQGLRPGFLLYPAQFWAHKNHANLILALKVLKEEHGLAPDLALVGADKGNRAHVERLVRECGLAGQVKMLGFVEQADLVGLYREALALSYMSFCGPENMPPLEAFALGCPVVASRIEGADEQLCDAALLVDPRDPRDIAHGIQAVHKNPELRETLRARGLARARRWTGREFVRGVFAMLDEFEPVRRAWDVS